MQDDIEQPGVESDFGGAEESSPEQAALEKLHAWADSPNIAADIDPDQLSQIAARVIDEWTIDRGSRADWEQEARLAMDAVLQKTEAKNYPFEGASNVKYPLMTTAALQFGARSYPAIVQGDRIARGKIIGRDTNGLKRARAERISQHMSWQLLKMPSWEADTDTLVHQMPVLGDGFRKVYFDYETGRVCSEMISAMHVVVNQATKSLKTTPRITHEFELYPNEIETRIRGETFLEFEYGTATPQSITTGSQPHSPQDIDAPHLFLEQHRWEDLDGDGYREPWIITVHKDSGKCCRVVPNFDVDQIRVRDRDGKIVRIARRDYFVHYPFLPDPNGGFYGIGFGRLLRTINEAVNTSLNQMIDAGHLQNAGGGFIGSGLNLKASEMRIALNEWRNIAVPGQKIRDAIVPHQFAGPSPVLFQLLGMLIDAGKQIASVQDVLTGESRAQTMQPTTLLALIEQGLKVFTSIVKRMFRSLAQEFELIFELNKRHPDEEEYQKVIDWEPPQQLVAQLQQAAQQAQAQGQQLPPPPPEIMAQLQQPTMAQDYEDKDFDIVPVADPTQVTDAQKMAKAQLIMDTALKFPNVNKEEALRRIYEAGNIEDIDKLISPSQPDPMMVEGVKAKVADTLASAKQKEALAAKAQVETQDIGQRVARDHAHMVSGGADQNAAMEAALQDAQARKADEEANLAAQQQAQQQPEQEVAA